MNHMLVLAGALIFAIGIAHSWLGERYILMRLFRSTDLPALLGSDRFTRRTLRFAWHITTVAWWGMGVLLLVAAQSGEPVPRATVGAVIGTTFLVSGLIALVGSRGQHLAWPVFLAIAIASWLGSR